MLASEEGVMPSFAESSTRNFRMLVANSSLSNLGAAGFGVSIIWIALSLTGSTVLSGLADGMSALPLLLSFFFGAYVDTLVRKKSLSIFSSTARATSLFGLFAAFLSHNIIVEALSIYSVAFVVGLTSDILNSISASWTRQFLSEPDYKKGTSALNSATSLAQAVGLGISGAVIIIGSEYAVYALASVFALSILPLIFIRNDQSSLVAEKGHIQSSMTEGMRYIFGDSRLRTMLILTLIVNVAFGATGIFLAVLVQDRFSLPAIYYTTLYLLIAIGIFVGSVAGGKAKGKVGPYSMAMILAIGMPLGYIGLSGSIYTDFAATFAIGVAIGVVNVVIMTGLLMIVRQEMMARVMGAVKTFAISLTFISGALGGILISIFGLSYAFYIMGGVIAVTAILPPLFREFYRIEV